ncbi:MAG: flagellar biosynthetic protein FliO [Deltaproteobacteria bacterium]|nr:flagellar biosynthetic protein FliO [Deltaproteobacteria bacterium]
MASASASPSFRSAVTGACCGGAHLACLGLLVCVLPVAPAFAAPAPEAFSWSGYFYAIGALCLILGALWGVLWLMRRSGKFRFMPSYDAFPRDALRIEAQIPLGPRRGLMVVRFLNKRLLLGLSDQQINLLSEAEYDGQTSADFSKTLEAAERQETDG